MNRHELLWVALVAALAWGCGDDDGPVGPDTGPADTGAGDTGTDTGPEDAGTDTGPADAGTDTGPEDAGEDAGVDPMVARGDYLVNHVIACWGCHTPMDETGMPIAGKHLSGQVLGEFEGLLFTAPNLTPHATGIGDWTDEQIKNAFLNGVTPDGPLYPVMPYYSLHNMSAEDADAIVAYLRSIPAVDSDMQKNPTRPPGAAPFIPVADIPMPTLDTTDADYAEAMRGRYLSSQAGLCLECHTERSTDVTAVPLNLARAYAGGQVFPIPTPGGVVEVYSTNLTSGTNGTMLDTAVLIEGKLTRDTMVCPPMPIGPNGYWGLTDEDARAIALYILNLPPVDSDAYPACTLFGG